MDIGIGSRVRHEEWGVGVVIQITCDDLVITFVNHGVLEIPHTQVADELEILEKADTPKGLVALKEVEETLGKLLGKVTDEISSEDMHARWKGGKLVFHPGNPELKSYEIPIDTFFHKIVMVRDRLRVMEQRINSSGLTDQEKVNLQQYITRIYGSLTSFNVLFTSKQEGFTGMGAEK